MTPNHNRQARLRVEDTCGSASFTLVDLLRFKVTKFASTFAFMLLIPAFVPCLLPMGNCEEPSYQSAVVPFLKTYCLDCHGPKNAESDFRVDKSIPNSFTDSAVRSRWAEVVNVLNSHEMPPEKSQQPNPSEVAKVVDWITQQIVASEVELRENAVVMRRLNRAEYRNTIRDLMGVDFDVSGFPQDPPASGFDNIGSSLSLSPMQMELYLDAARQILDTAIFTSPQPPTIRWRFEVDSGDSDSNRVKIESQNPIVNGGNNPVVNGFKRLHHNSWDKTLNVRDFSMNHSGKYIIRIKAANSIPTREAVVESARKILRSRFDDQMKQNPKGEKWHLEQRDRDLEHFKTDWIYNYGPARIKLTQTLAGQPKTVAEFDVPATLNAPDVYEIPVNFGTQNAGVTIEYAYAIPAVLENFWMQSHDSFARPELYVDWLEIEGPIFPEWPPASHRLLFPADLNESNEKEVIETWIGKFARRAFRRPVSKAEVAPYTKLYFDARERGSNPVDAYKSALTGVLVSPSFLFMVESGENQSAAASKQPTISDHQLATRLAYFLWSSPPDSELSKVADRRALHQSDSLKEQVQRMLSDPKSDALVVNFADQWLGLREVGANPPATDLYPHYDRHLETSMVEESRSTFRTILQEKRNVLDFVNADYVVINERLARFYEIENVRGDNFRAVAVGQNSHRGGILTQASMLTITSNGTRTSPVKRGTWVLKNVLGTDPGLPVANAGDIAPKVPGIDKATLRQRLEMHRELPQCARCHSKIDSLGLALENYNASGQYREQEGFGYKGRIERDDPRIDPTSKLPDGTPIAGPSDLKRVLRSKEDLFLKCLSQKLLTYALGRELTLADQPDVQRIIDHTKQNGYTLEQMILAIVQSDAFRRY